MEGNYQQAFGTTPPMGATPNIRSQNGSNLVLKNGTALNSPITYVPAAYASTALDAGLALASNAGKYNLNWSDTEDASSGGAISSVERIGGWVLHDYAASAVTPGIQAFIDFGASSNKITQPRSIAFSSPVTVAASAPSNPFQQAINVRVPVPTGEEAIDQTYDYRASGGVIVKLPREWMTGIDYTWNQTYIEINSPLFAPAALTTAMSNGTVDVLRDIDTYPLNLSSFGPNGKQYTTSAPRATLKDVTLRLAGPLVSLPAGSASISGLIEHRDEAISDGSFLLELASGTSYRTLPSRFASCG